jgi:N-acetylglucosamine-6-sulfatase
VDGRSLVPVLEGTAASWKDYLLFEYYGVGPAYSGVRTRDQETYVQYDSGENEYYDLSADPWQLESTHAAPENAERLEELSAILSALLVDWRFVYPQDLNPHELVR